MGSADNQPRSASASGYRNGGITMPNDLGGGTGSGGTIPTVDSPEVSSQGAFGRDMGMPISGEFLGYTIAVFTIAGTLAIIGDKNPRAAWVLAILVLLGMLVVIDERSGKISQFFNTVYGSINQS